jgi:hypothetical protein
MLTTAFYSVCDSSHFVGAVALLNSLRLTGHDEPILLFDAGLTAEQRDSLAPHVTLLPAPTGTPTVFLWPLGPLEHPARVAILLDADSIQEPIAVVAGVSTLGLRRLAGRIMDIPYLLLQSLWRVSFPRCRAATRRGTRRHQ